MAISLSYHTYVMRLMDCCLFCLLQVFDIYSILSEVPLLHLSKRHVHVILVVESLVNNVLYYLLTVTQLSAMLAIRINCTNSLFGLASRENSLHQVPRAISFLGLSVSIKEQIKFLKSLEKSILIYVT